MKAYEHTVCTNRPAEEWWHNTGSQEIGTMSKEHTGERLGNTMLRKIGQYMELPYV